MEDGFQNIMDKLHFISITKHFSFIFVLFWKCFVSFFVFFLKLYINWSLSLFNVKVVISLFQLWYPPASFNVLRILNLTIYSTLVLFLLFAWWGDFFEFIHPYDVPHVGNYSLFLSYLLIQIYFGDYKPKLFYFVDPEST